MPDPAALLAAYDRHLREAAEFTGAVDVRRHGPLWWGRFGAEGFCSYAGLDGVDGGGLDALIEATVRHFRDATDVVAFEWKTRGHDPPAGLGERLTAQGLVAGDPEWVMIGPAAGPAVEVPLPDGVTVHRAGAGGDLLADVREACALQEAVYGAAHGPAPASLAAQLAASPEREGLWLARAGGRVVGTGRLSVVAGTPFAGLWGGATLPPWRGRGLYRALTAARARAALRHGAILLHSDSTAMSRPILERSGLVAVTTTTPYRWARD